MNIQEQLKVIQKITSKTQEQLARELRVSFVTLNSWITGRSQPRPGAKRRIIDLYSGVTGQQVVPDSALIAKKNILFMRQKKFRSVIQFITKNIDVQEQLLLSFTYNTNRIEGSTLTEAQTAAILFHGRTIGNKNVIEHLEVKNHQAALQFLYQHLRQRSPFNEEFLLELHAILMNGIREDAGHYRRHGVRIVGSPVPTANYLKVPVLMKEIIRSMRKKKKDIVSYASRIHSEFERVHPFSDGNGRIGRLLMAAMLMRQNYAPAVVAERDRTKYLRALQKSQLDGLYEPLEELVCDSILRGFDLLDRK